MMPPESDLEVRFRWVSAAFVVVFGAAFVAGVVMHVLQPGSGGSARLLQIGILTLMAAPAARLILAVLERVRRRDWLFVLMTVVVTAELALVMWRASQKL